MLKKRKSIDFFIIFLLIGFASVSTTLIINGNFSLGFNEQEYQIYFSEAIIDEVDKSNTVIKENRKVIEFETKELKSVNEVSILDYEVTNNSRQYDALVKINCVANSPEILDYVDLEYSIDKEIIHAKEKARGIIKTTLTKAYLDETFDMGFKCTISADPIEKENANDMELEDPIYYTYGYLLKDNKPIENANIVVYSTEIKNTRTDKRGMFIVDSLVGGDYTLYVLPESVSDVLSLTIEEIKSLALDTTQFNTGDKSIKLEKYDIIYFKTNAGTPILHDLTFDTADGTDEDFTSKIIEGEQVGYLPDNINHDTLAFESWKNNDFIVNNDTVFNTDTTLTANYGEGVAKIGEKHFKSVNLAFDYAPNDTDTTIEVIKSNKLEKSINTDKNIILNLNEKTVRFDDYNITNSGNLTIENGSISESGLNAITNEGTLNLNNNLNIEHINNTNEDEYISTIINNESGTLSIDNASIITNYSNYVSLQSVIKDEGKSTINNTNIDMTNAVVLVEETGNMELIDCEFTQSSSLTINRMFQIVGNITVNSGTYKLSENNTKGYGLFLIANSGTASIKSGTFDNTYGNGNSFRAYEGTTLNLESPNKEINLIGNGTDRLILGSDGEVNIIDGTVNVSNGHFLGTNGKTVIGSSTTTPTINGAIGSSALVYMNGKEHRIIDANINVSNGYAIDVQTVDAKLEIDNINLEQSNSTSQIRAVNIAGELIVNDGNFKINESNQKGYGLLEIRESSNVTLNSGTFDNTYGKSNSIYISEKSTLNLGALDKEINIIGNNSASYTVYAPGELNIVDGTINASKGHFISASGKLIVGTSATTPTINGATGYKTLIYKSGKEHRIVNANINGFNAITIDIQSANAKLEIDTINLEYSNSTNINRAVNFAGELIVNDGNFKINESNQKGYGLLEIKESSNVTINSGTFDNTYGKSNSLYTSEGSTLNLGSPNKEINFIGNNDNKYILCSKGNLNIIDGVINASNGHFLGMEGKAIIGSSTTTPTISGAIGYPVLSYNSGNEHRIINANINASNGYAIGIETATAKLEIDNINLEQSNSTSQSRAVIVAGELIVNDGNFKIKETNQTGYGLLDIKESSNVTLNSGTFDSEYGKSNSIFAYSNSTLNIGLDEKNINFIGFKQSEPIIYSQGYANIINGIINVKKGCFLFSRGKTIIGSNNTKPIINATENSVVTRFYSGNEHKIINAQITSDGHLIYLDANATVEIENGKFDLGGRIITCNGTANINGGEFVTTITNSNAISNEKSGKINIGENVKNQITILCLQALGFPPIANSGILNIYSGEIYAGGTNLIVQNMKKVNGVDPTEEERLNYAATVNIYGGYLENNSPISTISITAGKFNMSGGSVVNKGTGKTITNDGGTAIQTGGISANNYGVTVQ